MQLVDQVHANEELVIRDVPENVDRYASLLSGMTDDAITYSQKRVGSFFPSSVKENRTNYYLCKLPLRFFKDISIKAFTSSVSPTEFSDAHQNIEVMVTLLFY